MRYAFWSLVLLNLSRIALADPVPKPNIVYIMMDDLGYGSLNLDDTGNPLFHTEELKAFKKTSLEFTQYYVNAPVCSPSRMSILTGSYPQRFNVRGALKIGRSWTNFRFSNLGIPGDFATVAKMLQEEGYRTAHFGKWHIGQQRDEFKPVAAGFDEYAIRIPELSGGGSDEYWLEVFEKTDGTLVCSNTNQPPPCARSIDPNDEKHLTTWLADQAIEFINQQLPGHQPFFLNIWLRAPHSPFNPHPDWADYYAVDENGNGTANARALQAACETSGPTSLGEARNYAALVAGADEQIGRIVDALGGPGDDLYQDTILIVTSDNGAPVKDNAPNSVPECLAANGILYRDKGKVWEGGNRVPLLVRWPSEIADPRETSFPMASFDWYRTLSDILGRDLESEPPTDGQSVKNLLLGANHPIERDDVLIWETQEGTTPFDRRLAVRHGDWKLVKANGRDGRAPVRLFDMSAAECSQGSADCESEDLLAENVDPGHQAIADALEEDYWEWRLNKSEIPLGTSDLGGNEKIGEMFQFTGVPVPPSPVTLCVQSDAGCRESHPFFDFHDGSFTFSMFVKPTVPPEQTAWLAEKAGSWRLAYRWNGRVRLTLFGDEDNLCPPSFGGPLILETDPLVPDKWNHVAFSVVGNQSTDAIRLFWNGQSSTAQLSCLDEPPPPPPYAYSISGAKVHSDPLDPKKVVIGRRFDGEWPFEGSVSHIRMFTSGLIDDEIDQVRDEAAVAWAVNTPYGSVSHTGDVFDFGEGASAGAGTGAVKLGAPSGLADHPMFDASTGPFTFSASIRPRQLPSGYVAWVAGEEGSWRLAYRTNGKLRLRFEGTGGPVNFDSDAALPLNAWSHIAFTLTAAGSLSPEVEPRFYIDGEEQQSTMNFGTSLGVQSSTAALILGGHLQNSNPIETFPGAIAGTRLFRDDLGQQTLDALAQAEIDWDEGPRLGTGILSRGNFFDFGGEGMVKLCASRDVSCTTDYPPFDGRYDSLTVSLDIRPDIREPGVTSWIAGVNCAWRLSELGDGRVLLRVYSESDCASSETLVSDDYLTVGRWNRVTFTLGNDGQGALSAKLYVAGVPQLDSASLQLNLPDEPLGTLVLGGHSNGVDVLEGYSGSIREVRVFLQELSGAEVAAGFF